MKILKYFTLICVGLLLSCDKLDIKPDLSSVVPSTLEDFQGILDNNQTIFNITYNAFGEISSNDFYVNYSDYQSNTSDLTSKIYVWNTSGLDDPFVFDWNTSYSRIFQCNIVLDGLDARKLEKSVDVQYNNIKGQALFHRAHSFYLLAEEFAPVYDVLNLSKPALPLRTTSDINPSYPLSSVQETYTLITEDLKLAATLLPDISLYKTRPSKPAAFALLARIYLSMEDYTNALKYAEACLAIHSELLNYNQHSPTMDYPFTQFNNEVIFQGSLSNSQLLSRNSLKVQRSLYDAYGDTDLRKQLFFFKNLDGSYGFKGSYNGQQSNSLFGGITTAEVLLTQAECFVRQNNISEALNSLNELLKNRFNNTFTPIQVANQEELLRIILQERRKELLFRGLRWTDLRRLNKDPRFAVTLIREVNGVTYTLPPNDPRYIFPLPSYATTINY